MLKIWACRFFFLYLFSFSFLLSSLAPSLLPSLPLSHPPPPFFDCTICKVNWSWEMLCVFTLYQKLNPNTQGLICNSCIQSDGLQDFRDHLPTSTLFPPKSHATDFDQSADQKLTTIFVSLYCFSSCSSLENLHLWFVLVHLIMLRTEGILQESIALKTRQRSRSEEASWNQHVMQLKWVPVILYKRVLGNTSSCFLLGFWYGFTGNWQQNVLGFEALAYFPWTYIGLKRKKKWWIKEIVCKYIKR